MVPLPLLLALYLRAVVPDPRELLDVDDESLLRAMADDPARVVAHIRERQRRIEWLEQELEVIMLPTLQGRRLSSAEQELRPESLSNQRAFKKLQASPPGGCNACKAAMACYSHACQGGKMRTDMPFTECADVPRAICDMYACMHVRCACVRARVCVCACGVCVCTCVCTCVACVCQEAYVSACKYI